MAELFPPLPELEPALGTGVLVIVTLTFDLRSDIEEEANEEEFDGVVMIAEAVLVSTFACPALVTLSPPFEVLPEELGLELGWFSWPFSLGFFDEVWKKII